MADEKKPKIDLKNRLRKMGAGGAVETAPTPLPVPGGRLPTPIPPPAIPVPPGVPSPFGSTRPPPMDPNNPLAAVAVPFKPGATQPPPAAPPKAQRIEVDEATVHQARSKARTGLLVVMLPLAVAAGVGGYFAGNTGAETKAKELVAGMGEEDASKTIDKLKVVAKQLSSLSDLITTGKNQMFPEGGGKGSIPAGLVQDLTNLKFDLEAKDIATSRFTVTKPKTVQDLFDFVTSLQIADERKRRIQGFLSDISKNPPESLRGGGTVEEQTLKYAALLDPWPKPDTKAGPDLKPPHTMVFELKSGPVTPPTKEKPYPEKLTLASGDSMARYAGGEIKERSLIPVDVKSMKFCVTESVLVAKLKTEIDALVRDLSAQADPNDTSPGDKKVGLIKRCSSLEADLNTKG